MKKNLVLLLLLTAGLLTNAQKNNFTVSTTLGVTTPILDSGIGFHVGVNPAYALFSIFSIEGQISYSFTKVNSSFISGNKGINNSINTLVGGRLYLNSDERTNRFYLNLLVGGNYTKEEENREQYNGDFNMGLSGGVFFESNKFLMGFSYETPQNILFKIGYVF